MRYYRLVIPALGVAIIGLGALAFFVGPPTVPAPPPPEAANPPAPVALADWNGLSVRNFGPVPQCADATATGSVRGLMRDKLADRSLGLMNVHSTGHAQIGDAVQWDCAADMQMGKGTKRLRYQIVQLQAGREVWQVTVFDDVPGPPRESP